MDATEPGAGNPQKNVNNAYDGQSHKFCLFFIVDKCRWSMLVCESWGERCYAY